MRQPGYIVCCLFCVVVASANSAFAQEQNDVGSKIIDGIFGLFSHASAVSHAKKAWALVDPATQNCVVEKTGAQPNDLAKKGIGPDDTSVATYIRACLHQAEEAEARKAEAAAKHQFHAVPARKARRPIRSSAPVSSVQAPAPPGFAASTAPAVSGSSATGQMKMGMTKQQVLATRGPPLRKDAVPPDYELWHYATGDVAFTNGRVSYVGH